MRILVTGGAGYIGSITVKLLLKKGFEVFVFDNLENGHQESLPKKAVLFKGDLRNPADLEQSFRRYKPQAIIHLAAYTQVEESCQNPLKYYENNVVGSLNLLRTMTDHKVKMLVFSSSAAVYGNPKKVPVLETDPVSPASPYGETKLVFEQVLFWSEKAYGIHSTILRYFNVAGAMPDNSLGSMSKDDTHLIPNVISAALTNRPITIFGSDYKTPDRTCIRDYVHVLDLANAHLFALEALKKGAETEIYNVSPGKGFSNNEIVNETSKITNLKIKIIYGPRRPGDLAILVSNPSKIAKKLGFKTRYSDIKTIIETEWQWRRKRLKTAIG